MKSCCSGCASGRGQAGPRPWTGGRAASPRPRQRDRLRGDTAGLVEAQGDPVEAGRRLGVHENTVRYRLRKMAEITELPLDDARKRLAMMIDLAVADND